MLSLLRVWVQSLVRELRSHKLRGAARKKERKGWGEREREKKRKEGRKEGREEAKLEAAFAKHVT